MRFHLPALIGQPTKRENSSCAYTQKIVKFAQMMVPRGHEVFIYGGGGNDAPGSYVATYGRAEAPEFSPDTWHRANGQAAAQIMQRAEPGDFLLLIAGRCQAALVQMLAPLEMPAIEFGIGYGGSFADFRVFESYAWMHATYAAEDGPNIHDADGRFFDAVIPNYFDPDAFTLGHGDGGYLLYLGRLEKRKGVELAAETAEKASLPLVVAGEGGLIPTYGEMVGKVGPERRAALLGEAIALLAPTYYLEPFGGVVVEAHFCGTPTITTDWGAFTETVHQGVNGYRCRTMSQFLEAVTLVPDLDREAIREEAIARYSLEAVAPRYEAYFEQVKALDHGGFYAEHVPNGLPIGA